MTPLERAAAAAREADGAYLVERTGGWMKEGGVVGDGHWEDIARAVLTAIREPSIAVVMAGANEVENGDGELHRRKWQAMIDAAISEKPE